MKRLSVENVLLKEELIMQGLKWNSKGDVVGMEENVFIDRWIYRKFIRKKVEVLQKEDIQGY